MYHAIVYAHASTVSGISIMPHATCFGSNVIISLRAVPCIIQVVSSTTDYYQFFQSQAL